MRITAGALRGRKLCGAKSHTNPDSAVRPTTARVREALFNILGDVTDWRVLDCFAGSGIMALEALSRGAAEAISIEQQRGTVAAMEAVRQRIDGQFRGQSERNDRWQILGTDIRHALPALANTRFDLIFADPPYRSDWPPRLPLLLQQFHITTEHLVIEEASDTTIIWPEAVTVQERRRYGESTLYFIEMNRTK
ncbi:MAG: 16S rRNA (guanine(966)-N(2))-methyltransferase RsmD [Mariprofundales bacterium]|nr:16S rRNA (guanine(966)-N(2))-methyltransferase RsmD [Mariprofundales bacterium]